MKLALFDLDGTLIDSRSMIAASLSAAFESEGLTPPDTTRMLSVVGLSLVEAMRHLLPDEPAARHARMAEIYKQAFWTFRASGAYPEHLFDGARALLARLHARPDVVLGIATGKSRRGVAHVIDVHGFEGWFATVQTADDHPSKPHPAMVMAALVETGVGPEATVMIGDTSFDIDMAKAAGVAAAGVAWGNHDKAALTRSGADFIANDFNDLEAGLEAVWQERMA